jgi:Zn-finger nucleic acid-binding protein
MAVGVVVPVCVTALRKTQQKGVQRDNVTLTKGVWSALVQASGRLAAAETAEQQRRDSLLRAHGLKVHTVLPASRGEV